MLYYLIASLLGILFVVAMALRVYYGQGRPVSNILHAAGLPALVFVVAILGSRWGFIPGIWPCVLVQFLHGALWAGGLLYVVWLVWSRFRR